MGQVWDAMEKYQKEQANKQPSASKSEAEAKSASPDSAPDDETRPPAPNLNGKSYPPVLVTYQDPGGMFAEQFRSLRTNVLARPQKENFSLMISSAEAREGKTVTCLNLAFVLAELPDVRVLVIDGDLRKMELTNLLRVPKAPGLAGLLRHESSLNQVIQPTLCPNLDVIPSGLAPRTELGELLTRLPMSNIMADLQRKYNCVLIDTPPITGVSDTGVIGRAVGEALMIVRMNKTSRESVHRAVGLLRAADVKILGLFLTHQKSYVPKYLYRYY
jgi:capsular exopolysaccharide synthesis family protein